MRSVPSRAAPDYASISLTATARPPRVSYTQTRLEPACTLRHGPSRWNSTNRETSGWLTPCNQTGPRPWSSSGTGRILLQVPTSAPIKRAGGDFPVQVIRPASLSRFGCLLHPLFRCLPDCSSQAYTLPLTSGGSEDILLSTLLMNSGYECIVQSHTMPGSGGKE
jgi:hypothetical protein